MSGKKDPLRHMNPALWASDLIREAEEAEEKRIADAFDFIEAQEYAGREIVTRSGKYDDETTVVHVCLDCGAEKGNPHSPDGCWWLSIMRKAGRRAP